MVFTSILLEELLFPHLLLSSSSTWLPVIQLVKFCFRPGSQTTPIELKLKVKAFFLKFYAMKLNLDCSQNF